MTGEQGEKGNPGEPGPTGAPGATGSPGATGATGKTGHDGSDGDDGVSVANYNSGWVDISSRAGQNITFTHNLGTTDLIVQIEGKDANGNIHQKYLGLESSTIMGWNQTYGESYQFYAESMVTTSDNCSVITGVVQNMNVPGYSMFLLKLSNYGAVEWYKNYNLQTFNVAYDVIETSDGGFAIAGYTLLQNTGVEHAVLLKTDSAGNLEWNQSYGATYAYANSLIQTSDGGYAMVGDSYSNGIWFFKTSSNGTVEWSQTIDMDSVDSVVQTLDGGYAIAGTKYNETSYDADFFLAKLNTTGAMEWNSTYGGTSSDYCASMIGTSDGGFALTGYTYSYTDGAVIYLVKTTADGTLNWNQTYHLGNDGDYGNSVVQASDDGFVITGYTYDGDSNSDTILLKTDASGALQWNGTYGTTDDDEGRAISLAPDGGYTVIGYTSSQTSGLYSLYLVRVFDNGTLDWTQTYSGQGSDYAYSVINTKDSGFAIAGYTISPLTSYSNVYLVKTSNNGVLEWSKTYAIGDSSRGLSVIQTSDGGFAIAGRSDNAMLILKTDVNGTLQWSQVFAKGYSSYGYTLVQTSDGGLAVAGFTNAASSSSDVYLVKTYANGTQQWNQTYGTSNYETCYSMVATTDGGFALTGGIGNSTSGQEDVLLLKVNASGTLMWSKSYDTESDDYGYSVAATADGGFAVAGTIYNIATYSSDAFLLKTTADGTLQWTKTYGGSNYEYGYSVIATGDGGYAIGGYVEALSTSGYDLMLIKTDINGTTEWTQTYGGSRSERSRSVVATPDGGFAIAGYTSTPTGYDICLYKTSVKIELGLARISATGNTLTIYRGADDSYWQYVRIQIWKAE
ncbi:MAG TPA: collagen-like protein [Candidatus Acidoferrales bacterium]|nr:collagen-like protein [Candidatus Acidoferrales bacterium]